MSLAITKSGECFIALKCCSESYFQKLKIIVETESESHTAVFVNELVVNHNFGFYLIW